MFRLPLIIALLATAHVARGQVRVYSVTIPPVASIQALSPAQSMTHPMTRSNLSFFDSQWTLTCNTPGGATARFSAPVFENENDPGFQRDVQLRIQSLSAASGSGWAFTDRTDRSRYQSGNTTAIVSMASTNAGSATVNLRVRFLTENNPVDRLPAGNYSTTVVGTITAN